MARRHEGHCRRLGVSLSDIRTHHDYLRRELPRLGRLLAEIDDASRRRHPELNELDEVFLSFRQLLTEHVEQEERALFETLRAIDASEPSAEHLAADPRGLSLLMRDDHDQISTDLRRIRRLTNGYAPPRDQKRPVQRSSRLARRAIGSHSDRMNHEILDPGAPGLPMLGKGVRVG